jgi:hypothetical protein
MTTAPALYPGAVPVSPSEFDEGDRVISLDGVRELIVQKVEPITIFQWGQPYNVWWIKGHHHGHDVQTVSLPRQKWYRISAA